MTERFNQAAAEWDKGDTRQNIAQAVFRTITSRIALLPHMEILDFGCGTGLLAFKVAPLVRSVSGVDLSEKMLEQLRAKNTPSVSVTPVYADILKEPLSMTFHGIISSMALHHVENLGLLFRAFHAMVKKDGFLALADLEEEDGGFHTHGNEGVYHLGFNREELRRIIEEAGFTNVRFHHAYTVSKENGEYPIFLVTATRW